FDAVAGPDEHAAFDQKSYELLGEQRVPLYPVEDRGLHVRRKPRGPNDRGDELRAFRGREWREVEHARVACAAPPSWAPLEQLKPSGGEDEQRDLAAPSDELLDEVEQGRIGPLEVLDHAHERPRGGEALQEATPRGEPLPGLAGLRRLQADQGGEPRPD